ncbi:MAG TPA: response regulator [Magnetospirillaceae bacterium]|nr:response regulator [Magnetospirillaceae bacterium]
MILDKKRVLIADDDDFSRKIVSGMIEKLGCADPVLVGDGEMAELAFRERGPFDVAILDFRMPGRNGLEILKSIRVGGGAAPREQRLMMLTGSGDYGLLGVAMALDVDAFVVKPITFQQMAERLGGIFKQWGDLKTSSKYEEVDIDSVIKRLSATLPSAPKAPPSPKQAPRGVQTKLENTRPGMVLSEDICGPQNQLVLATGVKLSQRMINRLVEVKKILDVSEIWVEAMAEES